jgi:nitrogen fixation-related uncharacterized protein
MLVWDAYLIGLFLISGLFLTIVVFALRWAVRTGQFRELDKASRVVFTDEEPEGVHTDFFPGKAGDKAKERMARTDKAR